MSFTHGSRKMIAYYINLVVFIVVTLGVSYISEEKVSTVAIPVATGLVMLFSAMVLGNVAAKFATNGKGKLTGKLEE